MNRQLLIEFIKNLAEEYLPQGFRFTFQQHVEETNYITPERTDWNDQNQCARTSGRLVYPKVMKNEIPKFVWSAAGVGYGIWTVSWFVAAFTSIRSGERAVKMIINSLYAAVCIVIWFWALKKYVDQNQTHFSMASFMLSALLSFVTIPYWQVYASYQHMAPLMLSSLSAAACLLTCIVAFYFYCQSQNLTISRILALCVLAILGSILVTVLLYNLRVNGVTRNGLNSWTTLQFLR